jgi:hypothetical protein
MKKIEKRDRTSTDLFRMGFSSVWIGMPVKTRRILSGKDGVFRCGDSSMFFDE